MPDQVAIAVHTREASEHAVESAEQTLLEIREVLTQPKKGMLSAFKKDKFTEDDLAFAEQSLERAETELAAAQKDLIHAEEEARRESEFQEMARRAKRNMGDTRNGVNGSRRAALNGANGMATGPRILLVEEDPEIRETTALILHDAGYDVIAVADQDQAINVMQTESPGEIKLLMTDIAANGTVNGIELEAAAELKTRHPDLRTLFISGQSGIPSLISESKVKDVDFLQRPFLGTDLVKSAHDILNEEMV